MRTRICETKRCDSGTGWFGGHVGRDTLILAFISNRLMARS